MVVLSLALLVCILPLEVTAQAIPDVIGERFVPSVYDTGVYDSVNKLTYSPDGKWYAYQSYSSIKIVPVENGSSLSVTDDILVNGYHVQFAPYGLDFSADSRKLVASIKIYDTTKGSSWYESVDEDGRITRRSSNGIPSIVSIDILSGEITYVADGQSPLCTPDGRYIWYSNYDSRYHTDPLNVEHQYELARYDILTGDIEFIEPTFDDVLVVGTDDFVCGPCDQYVYFSVKRVHEELKPDWDTDFTIARMTYDGDEIEELTKPYMGVCEDLQISSDGKWALFSDPWYDVIIANLETGNIFNVITAQQQYRKRPLNYEAPLIMRFFSAPFFYDSETKIGYTTTIGQWSGSNGGGVNLEVPIEETKKDGTYITDLDFETFTVLGDDIITAVDDLPEAFLTLGAYPNPFNPRTTLHFTLPEAGYTELEIFNFAGQKIRTLASGEFSAGIHSIAWDGRDENGMPVSSGIYLSRLTCRDNVVTSRMTLVK